MLTRLATLTLLAFLASTSAASAQLAPADNPWLKRKVLHMAHQGGELESPSNTFFAYERAIDAGTDMLEMDVNITADRELVVFHDTTLQGRTNGTGRVNQTTLAEMKQLDAAFKFEGGKYRGIATGAVPPPEGYTADDFKVPSLREVLERYPKMLMNIEIKGPSPDSTAPQTWAQQQIAGDPTAIDAAEELAQLLNEFDRYSDTIVVSFSDIAMGRFKVDAPEVHTAAALETTALFYASTAAAAPGAPNPLNVAVQPPTVFGGLVAVPSKDFVDDAHRNGLAVHVWMGAGEEDPNDATLEKVYDDLIDAGVDGIMTDRPTRLEAALVRRGVVYGKTKPPKPPKPTKPKKSKKSSQKRAGQRRARSVRR